MEITAVSGVKQTQTLQFIDNLMGQTYGQDCGNYRIRLEPQLTFFSFVKSAAAPLDPFGRAVFDSAELSPAALTDIGRHEVKMVVFQDLDSNDEGFSSP